VKYQIYLSISEPPPIFTSVARKDAARRLKYQIYLSISEPLPIFTSVARKDVARRVKYQIYLSISGLCIFILLSLFKPCFALHKMFFTSLFKVILTFIFIFKAFECTFTSFERTFTTFERTFTSFEHNFPPYKENVFSWHRPFIWRFVARIHMVSLMVIPQNAYRIL
jgi:hypothetical protein